MKQTRDSAPRIRLARRPAAKGPFAPVEAAIAAIRRGELVIVVDDEDRENEGDLTIAAEKVTADAINFMMTHGRGLICMPMTGARLDALQIPLQVPSQQNSTQFATAFCVGVEAKKGTTTGISAADRARTVLTAINARTKPDDLARPGHVFPLRARDGGVLVRAGQTEAAVDLARIAGLYPAGVICEIASRDGSMARVPELTRFARRHKVLMITVADLIRYRMRTEGLVRKVAETDLPTEQGPFRIHCYESVIDGQTHVALVRGDIGDGDGVLVRVHSSCLTGDVFHSARCDCGPQLHAAMQRIATEGRGVLLYLNQEGRGNRPGQQDARLCAAGRRVRHCGSQRKARLQGGSARLRNWRADPARPRCADDAPADEQSAKVRGPAGLRLVRRLDAAARDSGVRDHPPLSEGEEGQAGAPPHVRLTACVKLI